LVVAVLAAVVVGACNLGQGDGKTAQSPVSTGQTIEAAAHSCGGRLFEPDEPIPSIDVQTDTGKPTAALRSTIAGLSDLLPGSGWRLAGSSDTQATFVAPGNRTRAEFVFVDVRASAGSWSARAYGDCEPAVPPTVTEASFDFGWWGVQTPPTSASRSLELLVQTNYCGDEFLGPTVWYTSQSVIVTFWARKAPTIHTCPAVLETAPYTVVLAEPLGDRQLLAGPAMAAHPAEGAPTPSASSTGG
jgi:hypothetical protein